MVETLGKVLAVAPTGIEQTHSQKKPEIVLLHGPIGALIKAEAGREERIRLGDIRTALRAPLPTATDIS